MKQVFAVLIVAVTLMVALPARADLVYEVHTFGNNEIFNPGVFLFDYSFTVPDFLSVTTTIPAADLTLNSIGSFGAGCSLASATITNPLSNAPSISEVLTGCTGNVGTPTIDFTSAFDHIGTYTGGVGLLRPSSLTISNAVPEPSAFLLLGSGLLGIGGLVRRKLRV